MKVLLYATVLVAEDPSLLMFDRLTADHHGQRVASQVHLMIRIFLIFELYEFNFNQFSKF